MPAREEIIQTYGRMTPIFLAMEEQGKLEENWVMLRDLQRNPDPLPQPVIDAIIATLGLRCRNAFCFAGHSMGLMFAGATMIDIENLARALALPPVVPEHERWSRIVRLVWLAKESGGHQRAAQHALEISCSPTELAKIQEVFCVADMMSNSALEGDVDVTDPRGLAVIPEAMRELIPQFVQYHSQMYRGEGGPRAEVPVASMCSNCKKVRTTENEWYPFSAADDLLPENVIYSHGLCEPCVSELGFGDMIN